MVVVKEKESDNEEIDIVWYNSFTAFTRVLWGLTESSVFHIPL